MALFVPEHAPKARLIILLLLLLRVVLTIVSTLAVWVGLRRELSKTVSLLGTTVSKAKTVREMVSHVQDGDLQLLLMGHLVALT